MDTVQQAFSVGNDTATRAVVDDKVHHILSGSFKSISLFLLAFSPLERTLSLVQAVDAFGPHQYLAANPSKDRVYATTWALPPSLSSWKVERPGDTGKWHVKHVNNVPITATSSYITIPPPYTHAYSAGGPTGEVHVLDPESGAFSEKVQQILFVPEDQLEQADKTRVALRYGSHAVEWSPATGHVFIPVLGTNTIEMYSRDIKSGLVTHVTSVPSPRGSDSHDGPRHLKIHPNGKILYCVTEHNNLLDVYSIESDTLKHISSRPLLPSHVLAAKDTSLFRGDTLMLAPSTPSHPSPTVLFATTRGAKSTERGWLTVFPLDKDGIFRNDIEEDRWETSSSGGKANAIDFLPKSLNGETEGLWIVLTDDDTEGTSGLEGGNGVRILEWDGFETGGVKEVVGWPEPGKEVRTEDGELPERMDGASHAIWLD